MSAQPKKLNSFDTHSTKIPLIRPALCSLAAGASVKFHMSCRRMPSVALPTVVNSIMHMLLHLRAVGMHLKVSNL